MLKVRCCPADCAIKSNWEEELQIEEGLFKTKKFLEVTNILKILGNPSRLKIMMLLSKRDHCVCELIYVLNERQNLVSYNLGILKKYGLVEFYNRSRHKYYRLGDNAANIAGMVKELMECG
ncbi:Bacterial regulatory protein, arsR family [uncultured archaeon]|nr:Bacterial regulatory protein, arsR family [uncultured archaeon]